MPKLAIRALALALLASIILTGHQAIAGKAEREAQTEIEKNLKSGSDALMGACGCSVAFEVNWDSYKSVDDMARIAMTSDKIKENAASYCTDAASKKAVCQMKTIALSFSQDPSQPTFSNGKVSGQTNSMRTLEWSEYIHLLDK